MVSPVSSGSHSEGTSWPVHTLYATHSAASDQTCTSQNCSQPI